MRCTFHWIKRSTRYSPTFICTPSQFTAAAVVDDVVSDPAGQRLDRQRRVDAARGREKRSVTNPEIRHVPDAPEGIGDARARVRSHAAPAHEMGRVALDPEVFATGRLERPG